MRKTLLPLLAVALFTGLACGFGGETGSSSGTKSTDQATSAPQPDDDNDAVDATPAAAPSSKPSSKPPAQVKPLTCKQLETARLGSAAQPYNGYRDPIPLLDGLWSGEDGVVVQLQWPCAIGELTGDGAADAVVPVLMDGGGTGKFWQLAMFRNVDGRPAYLTMVDIGDRTPIEKVMISAGQARVEFLKRPDDPSAAADVVRRTSVYRLDGNNLVEIGYFDDPA
ncbi:hypothetical protein GA0074692_6038 [Micromonospora pallida]|uniref:Lipoprotein n=1 Tax=Micromonospora pallida TaxID=145854 RepID=A0A1C6TGJ4_9ACTN|nr:hypothetical protein [Micromonospora pallida]SCL40898.1 hypothetical protein GA0074692_6038 [Micromonospora pallida]